MNDAVRLLRWLRLAVGQLQRDSQLSSPERSLGPTGTAADVSTARIRAIVRLMEYFETHLAVHLHGLRAGLTLERSAQWDDLLESVFVRDLMAERVPSRSATPAKVAPPSDSDDDSLYSDERPPPPAVPRAFEHMRHAQARELALLRSFAAGRLDSEQSDADPPSAEQHELSPAGDEADSQSTRGSDPPLPPRIGGAVSSGLDDDLRIPLLASERRDAANAVASLRPRAGSSRVLALTLNAVSDLLASRGDCRTLTLSRLRIADIESQLFLCMRFVLVLDLSHNAIADAPPEIGSLQLLRTLILEHNKLSTLPATLCDLMFLETLRVSHNRLQILPAGIGRLRRLVALDAANNRLAALPDSLAACTELRACNLSANLLERPPLVLVALRGLVELQLSGNRLGAALQAANPLPALAAALGARMAELEAAETGRSGGSPAQAHVHGHHGCGGSSSDASSGEGYMGVVEQATALLQANADVDAAGEGAAAGQASDSAAAGRLRDVLGGLIARRNAVKVYIAGAVQRLKYDDDAIRMEKREREALQRSICELSAEASALGLELQGAELRSAETGRALAAALLRQERLQSEAAHEVRTRVRDQQRGTSEPAPLSYWWQS